MTSKYPKGSEWRKWDLHVHTPASRGFTGTYDQVVQQIIASDCAVIGINDYFTIEGYKEVKNKLPGDTEKTILPGVEMRMNNVLANRQSENSGVRINFHIIFNPFDEEKNTELISSVESFIKSINYKRISGQDGQIGTIYHDRQSLLDDVTVDYNEVLDKLEKLEVLAGNYLILLPYDEYGGVDGITSTSFPFKPALINRAHILGSANAKEISYFLGKIKDCRYFDKKKPCIKGSDSHNYQYPLGVLKNKESQPTGKFCWIKADPTFEGLKQIIREPEDRVYIGSIPPTEELMQKNKTKYIDLLEVCKKSDTKIDDIWFDNTVSLNTGLVAIIGNKGKGKSAIAETLGLMGYTKNFQDFSFLTKEKFLRNRLASNFQATIKWKDGDTYSHDLDFIPYEAEPERVKCIPQHYLERVCNNLDISFQEEIDDVIFSHIDYTERLKTQSLKQLTEYRTSTIDEVIEKERQKIVKINAKLIELEEKENPNYKKKVEQKLELKKSELHALVQEKPRKPKHPVKDEAAIKQQGECLEKINGINKTIELIEKKIKEIKTKQLEINSEAEQIKIVEGKISALKQHYEELSDDIGTQIKEHLGVEFKEVVKLDVSKSLSLIRGKLKGLNEQKSILKVELEEVKPKDGQPAKKLGLLKQLSNEKIKKQEEQEKLDEPTKIYQRDLERYKEWRLDFSSKNSEKREIKKTKDYIEKQLQSDIDKCKQDRESIIVVVFEKFREKIAIYKEVYKQVVDFINKEKERNPYMELDFSPEILLDSNFTDNFLSYIDQGRKGSFQGLVDGRERLKEIIQKYNFSACNDVIAFLNEIVTALKTEFGDTEGEFRSISEQLIKGKSKDALYAFLFLLRFLKIDYQLKWGDKTLDDLSPGERGTVLLIFYLLIDQSNNPLIIDQPEENLDNESVFYLLVKYIKEAKRRRQIIIVTHNPNLAVVCDAEQIIYCNLDKKNKYRVSYITGSIESGEMKKRIINVLEGTKPAFGNRQEKYEITSYDV